MDPLLSKEVIAMDKLPKIVRQSSVKLLIHLKEVKYYGKKQKKPKKNRVFIYS